MIVLYSAEEMEKIASFSEGEFSGKDALRLPVGVDSMSVSTMIVVFLMRILSGTDHSASKRSSAAKGVLVLDDVEVAMNSSRISEVATNRRRDQQNGYRSHPANNS
ncbi:unnamed protein product [Caenorhabditis auriculariae]|uniref:Uncharacterized protein n=1 Tax=Caenorhabditis auriculariae TaxID=2777116 RepID=A0A8S1HR49_9PELO|nr:unnamed protein product [Caenorhabditis auriculariae]